MVLTCEMIIIVILHVHQSSRWTIICMNTTTELSASKVNKAYKLAYTTKTQIHTLAQSKGTVHTIMFAQYTSSPSVHCPLVHAHRRDYR